MRDYNCKTLKGMEVPKELIDKALTIPTAIESKKPQVTPIRRTIAAAVVILVGAVSTVSYFIIRNINSETITAVPSPVSVESNRNEPDPTAEYGNPTAEPSEEGTSIPTVTAPTAEPTAPPESMPAAATVPIQRLPEPSAPTQSPGTVPTELPVITPTDSALSPSDHPADQDAVPSPSDPTEPPDPTELIVPQTDKELASVGYMVPISSYTGSDDLYCRLYSSSGRLIGGEDLYDESRRVYFTTGSGYLFLGYPLSSIVEPLPPDNYTIVFYDADGSDFYICSAFLSRK